MLSGDGGDSGGFRRLIQTDGELLYQPEFIEADRADGLFRRLLGEIAWQDDVLADAGRWVRLPRAVCWYGDAGAVYPYAGFTHRPQPWTDTLLSLKREAEQAAGQRFNGVLCNLYRHGGEAMGWHTDLEPALGEQPVIASLSLGAERLMRFRHNGSGERVALRLASGSLLIMGGRLQQHWRHAIPAMPEVRVARINLNFRAIKASHRMGGA
ncbi:alpha-ketoglutarate-dependent dioxygenase AlkB family protein [Methylomagnum sp.]